MYLTYIYFRVEGEYHPRENTETGSELSWIDDLFIAASMLSRSTS